MTGEFRNRGKVVVAAGIGINLALGVLYTWSIFKGAIRDSIETGGPDAFQWSLSSLNDPYAVCCLVFASTMILAGKSQDTFGPRITAVIGGILVGLGFILISQTTAYAGWILGFGVLVGAGIAFGYSSATPPAMKWFPPTRTGRVAGLVVAGFGLASVYIAPLAKYLLATWGLQQAMLFFGIAFLLVVSLLATFLVNPPEGFVPKDVDRRCSSDENKESRARFKEVDVAPSEMMRTSNFWLLWFLYFIGAGAGLMVISNVAGMAKQSLGEAAFWAVVVLAVGNAAGRIVAGILSDKIGGKKALASMFAFQACLMFLAMSVMQAETASIVILLFLTTFIGFNYGANLAIFPSFTKDLWGFKHFGVNYGIIFTSWGVGGFVMSRVSQVLNASTQTYSTSFLTAGVLLILGVALSSLIHNEKEILRREIAHDKKPLMTP
ncbi:MAG: OFA family MFS transporter [Candidatus Thiodiazotropha sp. (ex Epidulcina cf. delphinae)]|nr:OFA family MFS transporter [Candidatus Thiodiazotropha sp. (ex Epidulcina cf. delphinae)]